MKIKNKIPNFWPIKKLGEVAQYINGRAFKPSEWTDSGLPIIRIQNLTGTQEKFNYFNGKLEERYIVEKDDILLSWSASLGVYVWDKERAALNQHIFKVIPYGIINKGYLLYTLVAVIERLKKQVHGSTMTHITKPTFERNKILLPPPDIQHQIAERLDAIKKAQELNDKQIALADELFKSLLNRELDSKGTDRKMNKLEEVAEIIMGQSPPSSTYNTKRNGLPFLQGKFEFGEIYPVPIKFCSQPLRIAKKNDVLLSVRAPVGPVNLAPSECCIGRGLSAIRAKAEKLDQLFLFYFMKLNEERMSLLGCGSTFNAIGRDHIEKIKISLPSLQTQRQIVAKLQSVQDYKKKLLEQNQKLQELFNSCLDRAMKGKLVR